MLDGIGRMVILGSGTPLMEVFCLRAVWESVAAEFFEWKEFLEQESAAVDPEHLPLMLGMLMYEGDPESIEQVIATMSADTGLVIRQLAAPAFTAHSQRVHGTATPPRSTQL